MVNNKKKKSSNNKMQKSRRMVVKFDAVVGNKSAIDVAVPSTTTKNGGIVETTEMFAMTSITSSCTHGSTAQNLANASAYRKIIDTWIYILTNAIPSEKDILMSKFWTKHNKLEKDTAFIKYLFAFVVNMYLQYNGGSRSTDQSSSMEIVQHVLGFGISLKYDFVDTEKYMKYTRDIHTERGIINCLSRETSEFCHCMDTLKLEAKTMEKVGMCYGCYQKFLKTRLKRCSRCQFAQYCSNECMEKDWCRHKKFCTLYIKSEE